MKLDGSRFRIYTYIKICRLVPVAVYDGCDIVGFVHWLRLKQYLYFPWGLSPIYGCARLRDFLRYGMHSSCICSTLVSVCAMKGIPIGPLAHWGNDLTYYLTPFFCLVNWDMYYPGSACRGTDLPPDRILYIHTVHTYLFWWSVILWFYFHTVDPGGPVVIILATGSEVRGFKPGRGRWLSSE